MKQEKLTSFVLPIEKSFTPSVATSDIHRLRFRYPYVKALEVNNAVGVLMGGPGAGAPYQYQGGHGALMTPGQIIMVQPGEEYELTFLPQFGQHFVLWNHPDQTWLSTMQAGQVHPVVREVAEVIPAGGSIQRRQWIDRRVCAVDFHFWFGPSLGGPYGIAVYSMSEEEGFTLTGFLGNIQPILIYTVAGIAAGSEHQQGLAKCSTVLPALAANILQSRVFGRWVEFSFQNTALMSDGELTELRIKLTEH